MNGLLGVDLISEFDTDLRTKLTISPVRPQQVVHALERLIFIKLLKELEHNFLANGMGVEHDLATGSNIGSVLESTAVQTNLRAEQSNALLIELSEKVQLENAFSDLGSGHQVDLEKLSLEVTLIGEVTLESFNQESGGFSHFLGLEEDLEDLVDGSLGVADGVTHGDHLGERDAGLGVRVEQVLQDSNEVWLMVVVLSAVRHDLVELSGFNETLDHTVGVAASSMNFHSKLRVVLTNEVTKGV